MTKKILCIGINDYPGVRRDLSGCIKNANNSVSDIRAPESLRWVCIPGLKQFVF